MTFHTTRHLVRSSLTTIALALGLAATGCGGGSDDVAAAPTGALATPHGKTAAAALQTSSVAVQGCVLDRHYIPTTGTPVRALSADGRLLGSAQSDGQGRFTLKLPAQSAVLLQVDRPQGETLSMRVDGQASTWETCLVDDQA